MDNTIDLFFSLLSLCLCRFRLFAHRSFHSSLSPCFCLSTQEQEAIEERRKKIQSSVINRCTYFFQWNCWAVLFNFFVPFSLLLFLCVSCIEGHKFHIQLDSYIRSLDLFALCLFCTFILCTLVRERKRRKKVTSEVLQVHLQSHFFVRFTCHMTSLH